MYEKLLKDFQSLPALERKNATCLEICGVDRNENVSSNILAFFFDSNREHKLKNLFAKSLIEKKIHTNIIYVDDCFICEREVVTENNKRIDMLIVNKDITIFIENKIGATLYNDLDEYFEHIRDYKAPYGVVLSLHSIPKENQVQFGNKYIFIIYEELFMQIEGNLGSYKKKAEPKYWMFLCDYRENIYNLIKGNKMDKDFIRFLNVDDSADKVLEFYNRVDDFKKYLINVVKNLKSKIDKKTIHKKCISTYIYEKLATSCSLFCEWHPDKGLKIEPGICISNRGCFF